MRRDGATVIPGDVNLVGDLLQRGKVLLDRLIHQNVPVCQIEDLLLRAALQEAVNDLKSCICFARAGGHDEEQTILPARDGVHGAVDSDALIVARGIGSLAAVIRLTTDCLLRRRDARFLVQPREQFRLCRELVHAELALCAGEKIVLCKAVPVGAVCKRQIKHLRIGHGLLQTLGDAVIVVLCLYHRDGIVGADVKEIVRLLRRLTEGEVSSQIHLAVRQLDSGLHGDLVLPALVLNRRRNEIELDVLFGHLLFRQYVHSYASMFQSKSNSGAVAEIHLS